MIHFDRLPPDAIDIVNRYLSEEIEQHFRELIADGMGALMSEALRLAPAWAAANDHKACVRALLTVRAKASDPFRHRLTPLEHRILGGLMAEWVEAIEVTSGIPPLDLGLIRLVAKDLAEPLDPAEWSPGGVLPPGVVADVSVIAPPAVVQQLAASFDKVAQEGAAENGRKTR